MSISLDTIVDVSVEVSNPSAISSDFNLGLIIGSATVISTDDRIKQYSKTTYATQMVTDGFKTTDAEYKAATAYFSQNPSPLYVLIGVKGTSETDAEAVTACRAVNESFYGVCFAYDTTDTNMVAVAQAISAFDSPAILFYQTKDSKCLQASTTNVLKNMQDAKLNRAVGFYSTTSGFIAGVLGAFSGLCSMETSSAFTLAFKSVVGFSSEDITNVQLQNLLGYNGNVYAKFGRRYDFIYPGICAGGYHADFQYFLDAAYFLIQQNTVAGLIGRRVIPQTESGVTDIISFVTDGCIRLLNMGFIGTGIWTGGDVLELHTGDAITNGYYIQAGSLAEQSAADRAARISPPIYVALKTSGAIEHVVIRVFVNQ